MSRAYRPRLSKDKVVAQRVGEQLERELLGVDSLERQIAAFKRLEDSHSSSQSQKSDTSSSDPTAATTASAKPKVALKRKRATTARNTSESSSSNISSTNRSSSNNSSSKAATTRRSSRGDCSTTAGGAGSAQSVVDAKDVEQTEKGQWACPSCSFLNRETATQCSICRTKHYQPPSASRRGSGSVRGTVVTGELDMYSYYQKVLQCDLLQSVVYII